MEQEIIKYFILVIGAGFSSYVGVRVALTEVKRDIKYLQRDVNRMWKRVYGDREEEDERS